MQHDPRYLDFFRLFNAQAYYEAHEVLEDLWHEERRQQGPLSAYYKGLIQLAGAYTQLKLHHGDPTHRAHSRRLRPAAKLFALTGQNLSPYAPVQSGLDVDAVLALCVAMRNKLTDSGHQENPWAPDTAPVLRL